MIPNEQNYLVSIPSYFYGCKVEVIVSPMDEIIMPPKIKSRNNWEKAAKQMHQVGDDILLLSNVSNNENLDWWTWEE
jgi:antitoxin MazE